jgi:1,4-dihydroxy-2-naphthoate octaprenyltransferase
VGALYAVMKGAPFMTGRFLFGYMIILSAQLSVQYSNEYFDYEADIKNTVTGFSGGSGVLVKNPHLKKLPK